MPIPLINSIASWLLKKRMHQIELFIKYPNEVQNDILLSLVNSAKDTFIGKKYDFNSIKNYQQSLTLAIKNLELKEEEYEKTYIDLPQNEKILRAIDRELEIKEALYLLLLQKREEAAINFAVVRPSLKIIDSARTNSSSKLHFRIFLY